MRYMCLASGAFLGAGRLEKHTGEYDACIPSRIAGCVLSGLAVSHCRRSQIVLAFVVNFLADAVLFTVVQFMAVLDPTSTAYVRMFALSRCKAGCEENEDYSQMVLSRSPQSASSCMIRILDIFCQLCRVLFEVLITAASL